MVQTFQTQKSGSVSNDINDPFEGFYKEEVINYLSTSLINTMKMKNHGQI